MSRNMGTGSVCLGSGDFFSMGAVRILAAGPIGPGGPICADSRPGKAINKTAVWPPRMQSDCNAINICHPERSRTIREADRTAESKDPYLTKNSCGPITVHETHTAKAPARVGSFDSACSSRKHEEH